MVCLGIDEGQYCSAPLDLGNDPAGGLLPDEQKNWTHVRHLVGYLHLDSAPELAVLHQLWTLDALFTNYLLAQQESIEKHRH